MKVVTVFCIVFTFLIISTTGRKNETELFKNRDPIKRNEVTEILKQMTKFKSQIESFLNSTVEFTLPYFTKLAEETNLTESCRKSGTIFLKDLLQLKEWALRMLDSFGKPPSGILRGTFGIRGDYDQCLNIEYVENETPLNKEKQVIQGKYCNIKIYLPPSFEKEAFELIEEQHNNEFIRLIQNILKPYRLALLVNIMKSVKGNVRFDVCVPSTCPENDLENIAKYVLHNYEFVEVDHCETKQRKIKYSIAQVICIISFSLFFIWVILSTIIDIMLKMKILNLSNNKNAEILCKRFSSVSAFKSINQLFSNSLWERSSSLCGMKTILLYVYIFGHMYLYLAAMATVGDKFLNFFDLLDDLLTEISSNSIPTIETFFFISGYLTLFVRRRKEETSIFQCTIFLVKRIISLTIPILFTLATVIVFPLISDGPYWIDIVRSAHYIEKNWWQFIFHIQNFVGSLVQIIGPVWFLNALVQLTILTFPFIIMYNRWPKCGKGFLVMLILAGFVIFTTLMFASKNYAMLGYSFDHVKFMAYLCEINIKPYGSHLSSYCFGMLIGAIFSNKYELKISKNIIMFIWIAVFILMGLTLFGTHDLITETFPNETLIILHKIFSSYAWMTATAWICITSATSCGGVLHWFLSQKIFLILDRLNVWIFVLHPFAIVFVYGHSRNGLVISKMNLWMTFAFVMLFTLMGSFLYYVFLQYPMSVLIRILFDSKKLKKYSSIEVSKLEMITIGKNSDK